MKSLPPSILSRFLRAGPSKNVVPKSIENLSDFFDLLKGLDRCWYRGHPNFQWELTPSALRYRRKVQRDRALDAFREFRRRAEILDGKQQTDTPHTYWMQKAQHYGLPTRLLDWTELPGVALYFACFDSSVDGAVHLIDPAVLNLSTCQKADAIRPENDPILVESYASLAAAVDPKGPKTIAIRPIFNSARIQAQNGVFTMHGAAKFRIDHRVTPSLITVPIRRRSKARLRSELEQFGMDECRLFPELDKICQQIKREAKLT